MYYSYVEIEYVATSFSPARMDLALKLLRICGESIRKPSPVGVPAGTVRRRKQRMTRRSYSSSKVQTTISILPQKRGSTQIKYVNDDHLQFVDANLTRAYIWGMIEQCGLYSFCMQNLGIFALDDEKAQSAKGGERTVSSLKKDSIVQSIEAVPVQVQQIMDSFELTQQKS
jgi:hypothetical protein